LFSRFNDLSLTLNRNEFSFNSEKGWCPHCKGLGLEEYIDTEKLIDDPEKSLRDGALVITLPNGYTIYSQVTIDELQKVCSSEGFNVDVPWNQLTSHQKDIILYGSKKVKVLYGKHSLESRMKWTGMTARPRDENYYRGIIPVMQEILARDRNDNILRFVSARTCPVCDGTRLKTESKKVKWHGKTIFEYERMPFSVLLEELGALKTTQKGEQQLINALMHHLEQLVKLSVGHISANRLSETLSQGELRRMRLSQLLHNGLTGVLYLFDEPSIGLHPRDVETLIRMMYRLVNQGNTVVVVEHNEAIINTAQYLIELGPGAGTNGGNVVFSGTPQQLFKEKPENSPTATIKDAIINKKPTLSVPKETFTVLIEHHHNITNQKFVFAKRSLNVITGVSGAGKSSLMTHGLLNCNQFGQIVFIDQKPIGKTSRSNPATYTGLFDELRKQFAKTETAQLKKLKAGHFSFNNKQGQCEACKGTGVEKTGMHIFEDMVQTCPVCSGARYKPEILEVKLREKTIQAILQMTVDEAGVFFNGDKKIMPYLHAMQKLGLGYLHLGQSSTTLSGGEAQRIKLASQLHCGTHENCLYLLDEPTTGLHAADIHKLLSALRSFTQNGHTLVVVEHDAQIINAADWIVDVGPEGGQKGGQCLFCGTTSDFFNRHRSVTTQWLQTVPETPRLDDQTDNPESVNLQGISTHNLQNIDLGIAMGSFVAFTGVSGSGKTSLLLNTIHAEGQRLFAENLSSFRRLQIQFTSGANVQKIVRMQPTVAVEADIQRPDITATVASISGIYDLLRLLYARFATNYTGKKLTAADFSLENSYAVCPRCEGVGVEKKCDINKLIPSAEKPLLNGALINHKTTAYFTGLENKYGWLLRAVSKKHNIKIELPWECIPDMDKNKLLYGTDNQTYEVQWEFKRKNNVGTHTFTSAWSGLCTLIEEEYRMHYPSARGKHALELMCDEKCSLCSGARLNAEKLQHTFAGKNMGEILSLSIQELLKLTNSNVFDAISPALKKQLQEKLGFLSKAQVGYLPLNRPARYLSTGELKWIKLNSILSGNLSGMCIILDEPAAGLPPNAQTLLVDILKSSCENGNTILVSTHHKELLLAADRIIELGTGAGAAGGKIVADITPGQLSNYKNLVANDVVKDVSPTYEKVFDKTSKNQIQEIQTADIYESAIHIITGATGSGKTQLLNKIAAEAKKLEHHTLIMANTKLPSGNSQSTIATRTGLLNDLKTVFAGVPDADFKAADFSFNNKTGQCAHCKGVGIIKTTLDFLPDVIEICPECNGLRYNDAILSVQYN
ncbi:MAG: ATP-binding cassette domain-containing protein, partial [Salinivirgaceae bacterium]